MSREPVRSDSRAGRPPDGDRGLRGARAGIAYNSPESVENCRSKLRQREVLRERGTAGAGVLFISADDNRSKTVLPRVSFPCVVKPLRLSASQGVIRANDSAEFAAAVERIGASCNRRKCR